MKPCLYCNAAMTNPRRVQCGAPDCVRRYNNDRSARWSREYTAKHGQSKARTAPSRVDARKSNTHCIDCGKAVGWGKTKETRCRECWDIKLERRPVDVARRKIERAASGTRGKGVWFVGRCASDGEWWVSKRSDQQFCSPWCKTREKKARRRAAQKGCKLTPGRRIDVHDRDEWICQICNKPTDRTVWHMHNLAPTIDHIIPLGAGGHHAPDNWQTAHRICNSRKRDLILEVDDDSAAAS